MPGKRKNAFSPAYVTRLGSKIPGIGPIGKEANFVFLLPGMVFFWVPKRIRGRIWP
jgi:hypothetical protein